MARVLKNVVFVSKRELKNQVVYKKRGNTVYAAAWPTVDPKRKPTAGQANVQNATKRCNAYATEAIKDPELKAAYKAVAQGRQNAHNMAFKDARWPPEVTSILTDIYKGAIGDIIIVTAVDDFKVVSVKVAIYDRSNELIEEGECAGDGKYFVYTATKKNPHIKGCVIRATAYDLPGNEGMRELSV
jgi:hypothetical protein